MRRHCSQNIIYLWNYTTQNDKVFSMCALISIEFHVLVLNLKEVGKNIIGRFFLNRMVKEKSKFNNVPIFLMLIICFILPHTCTLTRKIILVGDSYVDDICWKLRKLHGAMYLHRNYYMSGS